MYCLASYLKSFRFRRSAQSPSTLFPSGLPFDFELSTLNSLFAFPYVFSLTPLSTVFTHFDRGVGRPPVFSTPACRAEAWRRRATHFLPPSLEACARTASTASTNHYPPPTTHFLLPFLFNNLRTLCRRFSLVSLCFQQLTHSFATFRGVGGASIRALRNQQLAYSFPRLLREPCFFGGFMLNSLLDVRFAFRVPSDPRRGELSTLNVDCGLLQGRRSRRSSGPAAMPMRRSSSA